MKWLVSALPSAPYALGLVIYFIVLNIAEGLCMRHDLNTFRGGMITVLAALIAADLSVVLCKLWISYRASKAAEAAADDAQRTWPV